MGDGKHFLTNHPMKLDWFKKIKLKLYKIRKIKEDKALSDRYYYVSFKVRVNDSVNPHEFDKIFNMVIPAKATFFAKRKLRKAILRKVDVSLTDITKLEYNEWEEYENDKERFFSKTKGREDGKNN